MEERRHRISEIYLHSLVHRDILATAPHRWYKWDHFFLYVVGVVMERELHQAQDQGI